MAFNGIQYALALAAASFFYHLLDGSTRAFELGETLKSIPWLIVAVLVFWAVNTALTALANYWEHGLSPVDYLKGDALKLLPNQIIYALLGMALGIIYAQNAFNAVYLDVNTGNVARVTIAEAKAAPAFYVGPFIAGTVAEAFRGFIASVFFLTVLGVAWYFSGRNLDILRTYDQATLRLVRYLEGREPYLDGHGERVAYYAQMMAQALKMPLYDQQKLRYAALLHDLGKTAVPREILLQKGALTGDEFERVTQHALVGGNWLEEVPYLAETAGAVLHHHEYYDGGGYLDGISGDTIPLNARILAVADAYDAMLNARPWREAKGAGGRRGRVAAERRGAVRPGAGPRLPGHPGGVPHHRRARRAAGGAGRGRGRAGAEAAGGGRALPRAQGAHEQAPPEAHGGPDEAAGAPGARRGRGCRGAGDAGETGQRLEAEGAAPRDTAPLPQAPPPPPPREPRPPEGPSTGEGGGA